MNAFIIQMEEIQRAREEARRFGLKRFTISHLESYLRVRKYGEQQSEFIRMQFQSLLPPNCTYLNI